jgi:hypothetical protein
MVFTTRLSGGKGGRRGTDIAVSASDVSEMWGASIRTLDARYHAVAMKAVVPQHDIGRE